MVMEKYWDIQLDDGALIPTKAHITDAGYDVYAKEFDGRIIPPGASATFDTGVHIAIPCGLAGYVWSKSGLNMKQDITTTGLVDSGYTGSIVVKLYNNGLKPYEVHGGDKIAQISFMPYYSPLFNVVDKLVETERGDNGFGSSGR